MIAFEVIASGSSGNAYRVTDGTTSLLIECGINYREIQQAFNFKLTSDVVGCLISHEHKDHAKSVKEITRAGINCYMSKGTKEALEINHHRAKVVEDKKQFKIGTWTVLPFDVQHDSIEPLGFLVMNELGEKLLFATDTYYIRYRFKGINIIAVECNYSEEILIQNILDGTVPSVLKNRLKKSHFSLENFLDFLRANDLSEVREVWLLHMSDNNSDEKVFKDKVRKVTGRPTYIA